MNDDIIRMAREAGFTQGIEELTAEVFAIAGVWVQDTEITELIERFAALVAAAEREACAQVGMLKAINGIEVAAAIRARGERPSINQPATRPISVRCRHQWFSTGAMNPGECRCIQCGTWGQIARGQA